MQITVTTTPTQLDNKTIDYAEVVAIRSASANILLGGPEVTAGVSATTNGWPYLATDDPMIFRVPPEGLWAVTASGTATVEVLRL